jgi:glutamine cyclotransferase
LTRLLAWIDVSQLVVSAHAQSEQLRYLQTPAGIAGDKTNFLVFGFRTTSWIY